MRPLKELLRRLLHVEDTPVRTALAFSVGIFFGYSPFLGLHTLGGVGAAFLFRLNRIAVLLGVWSNAPWWVVPYYVFATWVGMLITGFQFDEGTLEKIFQMGKEGGFLRAEFWACLSAQSGFFLSFMVGSLLLAFVLAFAAYPVCLTCIKLYRARKSVTE